MKKLWIISCMLAITMGLRAQDVVSRFLDKQPDVNVFTQVSINTKMFQLLAGIADAETENIIRNLSGMKIITTDKQAENFFREAKLMMENQDSPYETLVTIKEDQEDVLMYIREEAGKVAELVILVGNKEEFTLMNFSGDINLQNISHLAKSVQVQGVDYLDKLKDAPGNKKRK